MVGRGMILLIEKRFQVEQGFNDELPLIFSDEKGVVLCACDSDNAACDCFGEAEIKLPMKISQGDVPNLRCHDSILPYKRIFRLFSEEKTAYAFVMLL